MECISNTHFRPLYINLKHVTYYQSRLNKIKFYKSIFNKYATIY